MKLNRLLLLAVVSLGIIHYNYAINEIILPLPPEFTNNLNNNEGYSRFHVKVEKKKWFEASKESSTDYSMSKGESYIARGERTKQFFNLFGYHIFEEINIKEYVKSPKDEHWHNNLDIIKYGISREGYEALRGISIPTIVGLGTFAIGCFWCS
jgi:hypothetical protein